MTARLVARRVPDASPTLHDELFHRLPLPRSARQQPDTVLATETAHRQDCRRPCTHRGGRARRRLRPRRYVGTACFQPSTRGRWLRCRWSAPSLAQLGENLSPTQSARPASAANFNDEIRRQQRILGGARLSFPPTDFPDHFGRPLVPCQEILTSSAQPALAAVGGGSAGTLPSAEKTATRLFEELGEAGRSPVTCPAAGSNPVVIPAPRPGEVFSVDAVDVGAFCELIAATG